MIQTQTFNGMPAGMDQFAPPWAISPQSAVYMQDILLNRPGLMRRRGPHVRAKGTGGSNNIKEFVGRAIGLTTAQDPTGTYKLAALSWSTDLVLQLYAANFESISTAYTIKASAAQPVAFLDSNAVTGGTLLGTTDGYKVGATSTQLVWWKGATLPDYTTGNINTLARGDKTITLSSGNWTGHVEPGMFVFGDSGYTNLIGCVLSATSSVITLEEKALFPLASGNPVYLRPARGLYPRVNAGTITTVKGKKAVNGQNTKFISQKVTSTTGTFDIFRASDMTWVGAVDSSVTGSTDTLVTLNSNAQIGMTKEPYLAIHRSTGTDYGFDVAAAGQNEQKLGFLTANYAGRQWYANRTYPSTVNDYASRVWFSDTNDIEAVDVGRAGSWFQVQSANSTTSPIVAIYPTLNGLAIFKDTELWVVNGTDPSNFALRKVADVSLLSTQAIEAWGQGICFASDAGIMFYDGISLDNLTQSISVNYHQALLGWKTGTNVAQSMICRDHLFVYISDYPDPVGIYKGTASSPTTSPVNICICVNMQTRAVVYMSNFAMSGSTPMPPQTGYNTLYLLTNKVSTTYTTYVIDANNIFDVTTTGVDVVASVDITKTANLTAGPDFYLETGRFDVGDPERKKLFKQIMTEYICNGSVGKGTDKMLVATIPTLGNSGTQTNAFFDYTGNTFVNARVKFLKRATHLGFRMWQNSTTITDVQMSAFALGFKAMRVGRP